MASGLPKKTPTPRLLSRKGLKPDALLPSKFQREKFLSRKKEASTGGSILPRIGPFLDMTETHPKLLSAAPKQSWFGISPPEMVFQNFVAWEVSEMVLSLMNKDKMPQLVKVCMESCPYFQLACPRDVYHMVPAGASARAHPLQPRREQGLLPQAGLHHCKGKEFGPLVPELCWTSLPSWTSPSVQSRSAPGRLCWCAMLVPGQLGTS
ncbi:hydrocephalus-inducing protein-like isoform X3 [Agelaius tricolor]|uniref:hydrocephalus-inducing protein-like isoform X3 n=1 Tax=Agelaius tricolor TaxID=9191 RepID=UPI0039F232E6